jgi:hypothetical protein
MGNLFTDCGEYPDYRPMPSMVLTAAWLGLPPILITAMLAQAARPLAEPEHRGLTPATPALRVTTWVEQGLPPIEFGEEPHTHQEIGDPTPRAVDVLEISTSAPSSVPFIPYDDSANLVVMFHHARRAAAHHAMIASMSFSSPPALLGTTATRPPQSHS